MSHPASTCVVVFAKPPRPGRAKTRLARTLGDDVAARLAATFLEDTWEQVRALPHSVAVLATPEPDVDHGIDAPAWDQGGGDLGARVERCLRRALRNHPGALALGADAPGTPPGHLRAALSALRDHEAALGRSDDGGFWGLGLRRCPEGLLSELPWSAPDTADATEARLRERGLPPVALPAWFDLDEEDALRRWRGLVPRGEAPRTHAVLDALGWTAP